MVEVVFSVIKIPCKKLIEPRERKPVIGVSHQVRFKRAVQPKKMARGLKFQIHEVE